MQNFGRKKRNRNRRKNRRPIRRNPRISFYYGGGYVPPYYAPPFLFYPPLLYKQYKDALFILLFMIIFTMFYLSLIQPERFSNFKWLNFVKTPEIEKKQ